ncbi:MAG: hypothetical protein JNM69_34905, partial [Archangium sp.]|nr:hypothetical protein [Archangium sp.]
MLRWSLALVLFASCSKPAGTPVDFRRATPQGTTQGPAAATFAGDTITVAELNQRFAEMNP